MRTEGIGKSVVLIASLGLGIAASSWATTGLAVAETNLPVKGSYELPLKGNYGNKSGCNSLVEKWGAVSDDSHYITPKGYGGWEFGCEFMQAFEEFEPSGGTRAWTVITSCSAEGYPYSQLITVWENPDAMTVTIIDSSASPGGESVVLKRCN
jgi:hypothetical protein